MRLLQLNRENYDQEVINKDGQVLVLFESLQNAECRAVSQILKEIAMEAIPVSVATVNTDWNPKFSASHKVDQIPTLILYKDGMEQTRVLGLHSKEEILSFLCVQN